MILFKKLFLIFSLLVIVGLLSAQTVLFEVKDSSGNTIFSVYPDGIKVTNAAGEDVFIAETDSVRVYINDGSDSRAARGGFAIGSVATRSVEDYLYVAPDSSRVYVDGDAGFTVSNIATGSPINYLNLTPKNYFIGHQCGVNNTTGQYNSFFGYKCGSLNTTGNNNVFMGYQSGHSNQEGLNNIFIGNQSGYSNVGIGSFTDDYNVFIGNLCGMDNTDGQSNVFIGNYCGINNTTGTYNTFIGRNTGGQSAEGNWNVYLGGQSAQYKTGGYNNTFIGNNSGGNSQNGSGCVFIGRDAGYSESNSNKLYIDNSTTISPLIYGDFTNGSEEIVINGNSTINSNNRRFYVNGSAGGSTSWFNDSDERQKQNINPIQQALEKVCRLEGITFEWLDKSNHPEGKQMGFIAQEVEDILPEVVDNSGDHYSMQYAPITALLVEAIKEQQKIIDELKEELEEISEKVKD